jgi:hypothetical protein
VLEAPASIPVKVSALNNIGMAYSFMGDIPRAFEYYKAACGEGSSLNQWMNRFLFGLQLGRTSDAEESARMIDAMATDSIAQVDQFARARSTLRRQGKWSPSLQSKVSIRTLDPAFGPATRRIANVFN